MTIMASLHKDPRGKSPYFYAAFTLPDGRRTFRSTKLTDRKKALEVCLEWERAADQGRDGFAWRDVQSEVDILPQCTVDSGATGPVRVETYTVTFDREGSPERGILACRTAGDSRAWGNIVDPDTLALLCAEEGIGRTGTLAADGALTLD